MDFVKFAHDRNRMCNTQLGAGEGCKGCPMASKARAMEFARYPRIKAAYIRAFDRMLEERRKRSLPCQWQSGVDVFHWWMEDGVLPGQEVLGGFEE